MRIFLRKTMLKSDSRVKQVKLNLLTSKRTKF